MVNSNTTLSLLATSVGLALCAGTHANADDGSTVNMSFSSTSYTAESAGNSSWSSLSSPTGLTDSNKYSSWTISFTYSQASASTFCNTWGTAILATGTNALAQSYSGGFQIYWQSGSNSGKLVVKCGGSNSEKTLASSSTISNSTKQTLNFVLSYNLSASELTVTVSSINGTTDSTASVTISTALSSFTSLSSALASGDSISNLQGYATLVAVPEPSAFGLLAGIGALVLVASRRRRKPLLRRR